MDCDEEWKSDTISEIQMEGNSIVRNLKASKQPGESWQKKNVRVKHKLHRAPSPSPLSPPPFPSSARGFPSPASAQIVCLHTISVASLSLHKVVRSSRVTARFGNGSFESSYLFSLLLLAVSSFSFSFSLVEHGPGKFY